MMRIVIDLQGAQCKSRDRGIGRYSLALAQAMVRNRGSHEVIIALSGLFPETIEPIRAAFDGVLPQENIRVWHAQGPVDAVDTANTWRRHTAELIREYFLASLQPDIVHITSLFDGSYDNAVHSIGLSQVQVPTAVTFYDLIPLIQSEVYLTPNPNFEAIYREKLDHLRRSDLYLAISESSRLELIEHLDIAPEKAVNIAAAANDHFKPVYISKSEEQAFRKNFGLTHPFLMYSGATDERKNHLRLIKAFSLLQPELKQNYQLAIVGNIPDVDRKKFEAYTKLCGLKLSDVIITGQVSDEEMVRLYNLCELFVFPSWHEGFGLPALEAMSCGAPVIGANTTSLPEVIGRSDALFDPFDEKSIAQKITEVLTNDDLRADLAQHGLKQAKSFSWDESAHRSIAAFEQFHAQRHQSFQQHFSLPRNRLKLAFVSPLPPERSGISDYSAELLPELSRHYDIDVIVAQETITDSWISTNCSVRDVAWFVKNSRRYDRVLYHFGNSHFHQHMFDLLAKIPGIVVLHDFFLSGIFAHMDAHGLSPNGWNRESYHAHGYKAVQEQVHSKDWNVEIFKYPCNKTVVENAQGVIVHSDNSRRLGEQWLGEPLAKDWSVIPLLRVPAITDKRVEARLALGLNKDAFIVSSFGMLGSTKQNQRLLDAWLASSLSKDKRCLLVFVGEKQLCDYCAELTATISNSGFADRIRITGWTDTAQFRQYLAAADVGVQLRTLSRGETSAAVLDCMNYGLPTIVNANGSMADLSTDAVWMLPDDFDDAELTKALETLWKDEEKRNALGARAREVILTQHAPQFCANRYAQSIENYYANVQSGQDGLIKAIGNIEGAPTGEQEWLALARSIAQNHPPSSIRQLLVDVSALIERDIKTGIQRVVRSALAELLKNPPAGFRVEPVYAIPHEPGYRYARQFTLRFLDCPDHILVDETVEAFNGDVFLGLDLQQHIVAQQISSYQHLRRIGVQVYFVVYDLLPVLCPEVFPEGASSMHASWLSTIEQADGVVCISRAVADEMSEWLSIFGTKRMRPFKLGWFHLGADVTSSVPTTGLPAEAGKVFATIDRRPTFLMVGTIEPRKGYLQTLSAFEKLWKQGVDVNLVIVGFEGWKGLPERQRRTIPLIVHSLLNHPECNRRLFWLEGISDEYLENIYASSSCLIAASEGEGFGLPLIEAAQHKKPIIARDIPVFREVAGRQASYFLGLEPDALADAVREWLALDKAGQAPQSDTMPWLTWKQSTQNLLDVMLRGQWYQQWMPDDVYRCWGGDSRLSTQVGKRTGRNMVSAGAAGYLLYGPYIPLVAGKYWVMIRGGIGENGLAGAHMDAVADKGSVLLGKSVLSEPDENGNFVALLISLDVPCTDLEVRVWVSKNTDLHVSMIEIAPWQDEQETSNTEPGDISEVDSPDREAASIEPADRQEMTRGMSFSPPVTEPAPDAMLVEVEAEVSQQELAESSALVQPALSAPSNKFAVVNDDSDPFPAPQSAEVEMLFDSAQASNDPSAPGVMPIPSAAQNKWQPTSTERNRAKTKRKKNR